MIKQILDCVHTMVIKKFTSKINYEKLSFSSFHLNTSLIPVFNYMLLLSLNSPGSQLYLMYCDLEYDN